MSTGPLADSFWAAQTISSICFLAFCGVTPGIGLFRAKEEPPC